MWGVILRSVHHPRVGFENQSNTHRDLLVGNGTWASVLF